MYFKQISEIACRQKRCTQRVCKDGEAWISNANHEIMQVESRNGVKWAIGRDYAVSPGRGQPTVLATWYADGSLFGLVRGVAPAARAAWLADPCTVPLRIRVTRIERVRLQSMDERVAVAEGVADLAAYITLWRSINTRLGTRWEDNPLVWRLWFEVAR